VTGDLVLIICDDPSHGDKVVTIEQMVDEGRGWIGTGSMSLKAKRAAPEGATPEWTPTWSSERDDNGNAYLKHRWRCVCGLDVKARSAQADPIFDTLAANGVPSIPLGRLATMLESARPSGSGTNSSQ
jgi:hypothetical protein